MLTQRHTKPLTGAEQHLMVGVAQLVEHRTVTAKVAGSNPVAHPNEILMFLRTNTGLFTEPARSTSRHTVYGQVAQLVEQGTENPRAGGSIPSLTTTDP